MIIKNKIIGALIVLIALLGGSYTATNLGSVGLGNEYHATTTRSNDTATIADLAVLKSGSGALGSVIITGVATGIIFLYDATSTVTNTEWATTTLAVFPASTVAGTYTFDAIFLKGLLIDYSGTLATSTITWR